VGTSSCHRSLKHLGVPLFHFASHPRAGGANLWGYGSLGERVGGFLSHTQEPRVGLFQWGFADGVPHVELHILVLVRCSGRCTYPGSPRLRTAQAVRLSRQTHLPSTSVTSPPQHPPGRQRRLWFSTSMAGMWQGSPGLGGSVGCLRFILAPLLLFRWCIGPCCTRTEVDIPPNRSYASLACGHVFVT
jgi:hypothetical protein